MHDPCLPQGAFARLGIVALTAALCLAPQIARADDGCGPFDATQAIVTAWGGGALIPLGDRLAAGLRATDYPTADAVFGAALPLGEFAVVYAVEGRACRARILSQSEVAALETLVRGGGSLAGPSL